MAIMHECGAEAVLYAGVTLLHMLWQPSGGGYEYSADPRFQIQATPFYEARLASAHSPWKKMGKAVLEPGSMILIESY